MELGRNFFPVHADNYYIDDEERMDPVYAKIRAEIGFLESRLADAREHRRRLKEDDLPKFIKWVVAGSEVYRQAGDQGLEAAEKALIDAQMQLYYLANGLTSRRQAALEKAARFLDNANAYLNRVYAYRSKEAQESIPAAEKGITGTQLGALGTGALAVCSVLGSGVVVGGLVAGAAACATAPERKKQDLRRKAEQYHLAGNRYFDKGDWSKALESCRESLAISETINDHPMQAMIHMSMGRVYQSKSQWTKALEHYWKSLGIKEKLDNHNGIADTYNSIGIVHQLEGRWTEALDAFTDSLAVSQSQNDSEGMVRAYINIGRIHQLNEAPSKALEYYKKALLIAERDVADHLWAADICDNIALIYYFEENFKETRRYFEKSLNIRREFNDQYGMAKVLGKMGNVYLAENNSAQALKFFKEGLDIITKLGNSRQTANAYLNAGKIFATHDLHDVAEEFFNKSLTYSQGGNDWYGTAKTLYQRGLLAIKMGNYPQARQDLRRVLKIVQRVGGLEIADDAKEALQRLEEK